eukprot:1757434-Rhodomonas_salina.3
MPGTARAYAAALLDACYAMSGTDLGYAATRPSRVGRRRPIPPYVHLMQCLLPASRKDVISPRACYAMSGTDLAYQAPFSVAMAVQRALSLR